MNGPRVFGHESAGIVSKVGVNVTRLSVGDRVAIEPNVPCRKYVFTIIHVYLACKKISCLWLVMGRCRTCKVGTDLTSAKMCWHAGYLCVARLAATFFATLTKRVLRFFSLCMALSASGLVCRKILLSKFPTTLAGKLQDAFNLLR